MNILFSMFDTTGKYFIDFGNGNGITWYSFCILTGIILAAVIGLSECKKFNIAPNLIIDGLIIIVPISIIGARLFYVLFEPKSIIVEGDFFTSLKHIFGVYESNGEVYFQLAGLSILGAFIAAAISTIIYCKKRKMNLLAIFDLLAPGFLIGQVCGRWGNFFNQEACGPIMTQGEFDVLKNIIPKFIMDKMYIDSQVLPNHPTFFYEGTLNFIALIIILVGRRVFKKMKTGDALAFYLTWYGLVRGLFIEPLRTDPLPLSFFGIKLPTDWWFVTDSGDLRISLITSLLMAVLGIIWIVLKHTTKKFDSDYYIELQEKIAKTRINTVVTRVEDVLVDFKQLLRNAYYYTFKEINNKELSDNSLNEMIAKSEEAQLTKEQLEFFYDFIEKNSDQIEVLESCKSFYKSTYKTGYNLLFVSKYSKKLVEAAIEKLKIGTYIHVYYCSSREYDLRKVFNVQSALYISNDKKEINEAKKNGYSTASKDLKLNPDCKLKSFQDLSYIIF